VRSKFKWLRRKTKGARDWFGRVRPANSTLFIRWQLCHGNGRNIGSRVSREVHARFWERFWCKRQKDGIFGVNTPFEGANPNAEH